MPLLHWLTRDEDLTAADRGPFRLLDEAPDLGAGEASENLLVQRGNFEALKALLPFYAGQVKCIYIDPAYNTRSAFEHDDDSLEQAQWLAMIVPRSQLLVRFLRMSPDYKGHSRGEPDRIDWTPTDFEIEDRERCTLIELAEVDEAEPRP